MPTPAMTARITIARTCLLLLLASAVASDLAAQMLTYSRGQTVSPAFEGWEEDADGSKFFLFGYMNRNWEEEVVVPVGPDNGFDVGGVDQGQPTRFLPRRNRMVFRVPVPKHFTEKEELVWTLTTKGKTERAFASIKADYKLDTVSKMSETGALGAGFSSPEVRANKPPTLKLESPKAVTAKVGQPVRLSARLSDDGVPKPRPPGLGGAAVSNRGSRRDINPTTGQPQVTSTTLNRETSPPVRVTPSKVVGLHASWFVYRGAGKVTFEPEQIQVWEDPRPGTNSPWAPVWTVPELPDGKSVAEVTFHQPGTYVIRVKADDGGLAVHEDVTVTVTK